MRNIPTVLKIDTTTSKAFLITVMGLMALSDANGLVCMGGEDPGVGTLVVPSLRDGALLTDVEEEELAFPFDSVEKKTRSDCCLKLLLFGETARLRFRKPIPDCMHTFRLSPGFIVEALWIFVLGFVPCSDCPCSRGVLVPIEETPVIPVSLGADALSNAVSLLRTPRWDVGRCLFTKRSDW